MFMCFDLSICFRHYPTSQRVMSGFPLLINLWIIPNLQVDLWIFMRRAIVQHAPIQERARSAEQRRQEQVSQTSRATSCKELRHSRMTGEHRRLHSIRWCVRSRLAWLSREFASCTCLREFEEMQSIKFFFFTPACPFICSPWVNTLWHFEGSRRGFTHTQEMSCRGHVFSPFHFKSSISQLESKSVYIV